MNSKGAISIFLIIILMSSTIFGGFFIDASRIVVAERKTQNVLNSAARSVMAEYDENLVGEFGIYALNKDSDKEFNRYLETNIKERHKGIRFIDYKIESYEIEGVQELLSSDSLNEQIMEYMKYKAPVIATVRVIDKFKRAFSTNATKAYKSVKNTDAAFKTAKQSVNNVVGSIKQFAASALKSQISDLANAGVEDICDGIDNLIEKSEEMVNKTTEAQNDINTYGTNIDNVNKEIVGVVNEYESDSSPAEKTNVDDVKLINSFESTSEKKGIKDQIAESESSIKDNITRLQGLKAQVQPLVNKVIEKKAIIKQNDNQIDGYRSRIAAELSKVPPSEPNSGVIESCNKAISELNNQNAVLRKEISDLTNQINKLLNGIQLKDIVSIDKLEDPSNENVDTKDFKAFETIKKTIEGFQSLLLPVSSNWFVSAEDVQSAVQAQTASISNMENETSFGVTKAMTQMDSLSNLFTSITSLLSDLLSKGSTKVAENVYQTEYIMDKFTFVTSTTERDHYWRRGEVEYVIFGNKSAIANMSAGVGSVFAIRFVINAFTEFFTSKVPELLTRIITSLAIGLAQSIEDMIKLLGGENGDTGMVPVCRKLPKLEVSYSDHLRLLLLMAGDKKLERIKDLMQIDVINIEKSDGNGTGFRLKEYNTSVSAETKVSVNLLFLPMLGIDKMGFKNISNGRYYIEKKVYMGY